MKIPFPLAPNSALLRRFGSSLALTAALTFALQPGLALAQIQVVDPDQPAAKAQPKPVPPAKAKKASRTTPTDNVSDDLNRRESERAAQIMQAQPVSSAPAPSVQAPAAAAPVAPPAPRAFEAKTAEAKPVEVKSTEMKIVDNRSNPSEPPTVAAIPPRPPIMTASLTPDAGAAPAPSIAPNPSALPAVVTTIPSPVPTVQPPAAKPQLAQATPPTPSPVPIQPPSTTGAPPAAPVVTGAPSRNFAQSQLVPTQQPTLTLEINKGTAVKLPGAAATVFVAAPDIADVQVKSPTMIYVFAKKPGDTVLYAVDDQDRVLLNTIVSVTSPVTRMKATLDQLHPDNGVMFENQGETIVLVGTVRSAVVAEDARRMALAHVNNVASRVVNNIRVNAPNQVQLRVKVAEVNRGALKRVGINWQNINNIALFGMGGILAGAATSTIQAAGGQLPGSARVAAQTADNGLNSLVDLLATQAQATILAEPNLIAMSGESASFLAGGEIPVIQPQAGGVTNTITVAYKQVGISLAFTPTIVGDRINLKVAPEVSQVTTEGQVSVPITATATVIIPAIQTRKALTTVELGSGQSFAIAGLLQHTTKQDILKVPWLGDVPVLGTLFKSDAYQRQETELVIIVTPYFVEPVSTKLRTPLTGRVPPTDADRLIYQRFNHPTPPQRTSVGREQQVSLPTAGFKLD